MGTKLAFIFEYDDPIYKFYVLFVYSYGTIKFSYKEHDKEKKEFSVDVLDRYVLDCCCFL